MNGRRTQCLFFKKKEEGEINKSQLMEKQGENKITFFERFSFLYMSNKLVLGGAQTHGEHYVILLRKNARTTYINKEEIKILRFSK